MRDERGQLSKASHQAVVNGFINCTKKIIKPFDSLTNSR